MLLSQKFRCNATNSFDSKQEYTLMRSVVYRPTDPKNCSSTNTLNDLNICFKVVPDYSGSMNYSKWTIPLKLMVTSATNKCVLSG